MITTEQREAIREVLAVVDDRAARGLQVSEFRRIFTGYHSHRHMHIGGRDSPLGVCYRKEEIPRSGGQWVVFARFDTLDVLDWCLKVLKPTIRQKELFLTE
jgi:hypothetical protein